MRWGVESSLVTLVVLFPRIAGRCRRKNQRIILDCTDGARCPLSLKKFFAHRREEWRTGRRIGQQRSKATQGRRSGNGGGCSRQLMDPSQSMEHCTNERRGMETMMKQKPHTGRGQENWWSSTSPSLNIRDGFLHENAQGGGMEVLDQKLVLLGNFSSNKRNSAKEKKNRRDRWSLSRCYLIILLFELCD